MEYFIEYHFEMVFYALEQAFFLRSVYIWHQIVHNSELE